MSISLAASFALVAMILGSPLPMSDARLDGAASDESDAEPWTTRSIHTLELRTLEGKPAPLSAYKGKVLVVVNVASRCGYTRQYEGLQALSTAMKDRDVVVLGVPCNDFGGQEPGSPAQIRSFCTDRFGVTFPMLEKVRTASGEGQSPLYTALAAKTGSLPKWNFGKYVVTPDGRSAVFLDSGVTPGSDAMCDAIEQARGAGRTAPSGDG